MARFIKDHGTSIKQQSTGGIAIPTGTTSERLSNPATGDIRYNTDLGRVEVFDGLTYDSLSPAGVAGITQDSFTGDSVTVAFTMSTSVTNDEEQRVIVAVGNVFQNPATAYTLSGSTITFTSPPGNTESIVVIHGFDSTATTST